MLPPPSLNQGSSDGSKEEGEEEPAEEHNIELSSNRVDKLSDLRLSPVEGWTQGIRSSSAECFRYKLISTLICMGYEKYKQFVICGRHDSIYPNSNNSDSQI